MSKRKKHPGGRPRLYKSPEEMQEAIDAYFAECSKHKKKPIICGLALALGFVSRNSLLSYEGYSQEYFGTIKKAKARVEAAYEEDLRSKHVRGAIFALKNFNWTDRQDITSGGLALPPVTIVNYANSTDKPTDGSAPV